jgi:diacylglycerol O-acyltransferase / wax synthase
MAAKTRQRMSSVDRAWLRMDRPSNLMMICGVLILRERMSLARLRTTLADRFLRFTRFRQRAVQTPAGAYWETVDSFDLATHVRPLALSRAAGKSELQALAGELMATPLDPALPLWQFHLVEKYGSGSAIIVRIHHCYADGIALIQVMLSMTDDDRAGKPSLTIPPRSNESVERDPLLELFEPIGDALKIAKRTGAALLEKGAQIWQEPAKAVALAEKGAMLTSEVASLVAMGEDSRTIFKGTPGVAKRVAWTEPLPLSEVKTIGRAFGCSINDVLLSSVAGALRAYLVSHGQSVDAVSIRALVPVNLRAPDTAWKLGNRFGLVFLDLPIGIQNPVERLYAIRANMRALKDSYQPFIALGLLAAMGAGPAVLQEQLLAMLAKNATAVMTNVPGPQQTLFFAGRRIDNLMFWVPQSGDIGMGVSILSYDGAVQFGIATDRELCPDPEDIIDRFRPEFETLVMATLMSPWPWDEPPAAADVERSVQGARAA